MENDSWYFGATVDKEKFDLKDIQRNNYKDSIGSKLAIELTIGGKF